MNRNTEMNIPGLSSLKTIGATSSDMKEKVNELQKLKRDKRLQMNTLQEEINKILIEIPKQMKREEKY